MSPLFQSLHGKMLADKRNDFDYQGPVRLYEKAGFVEVARKDGQIIMRKML